MIRLACLILALFLLMGCKQVEYVPVKSTSYDTVYLSKIKTDSIYCRDSVFVSQKGDTVTLYKYKYLYKYALRHDTLWREQTDTISVVQPVEKQLTKWQTVKMEAGGYAIAILIAVILGLAILIVYRVIKK